VNAAESKISSINVTTDLDSNPIQSNSSYPAVIYNPYYQDIGTLQIQILNTTDNSIPSNVQLGIFGCAQPPQSGIKAVPRQPPTSTSISCKYPF
jgi:hypothetical protein